MNKKQLFVMWVGIGIIVLMGIFPPLMLCTQSSKVFLDYGFIVPQINGAEKVALVDFSRLLTQWVIVSVLTIGLIITFKDKGDQTKPC